MIKVLFMGRKQVATEALEFLLTLDNVQVVGVLTDSHLQVSSTTALAKKEGLSIYTFEQAKEQLSSGQLSYDLGLSMLYWRKLKGEFLTVPSLGNVNFHPAPLPEYKGTAGYNLAIMDELDEWAATAHYIDENIDTGGIVDIFKFSIFPEVETAQTLEAKTRPFLLDLFKKTTYRLLRSDDQLDTQPNIGGRYVSRSEMESMKEIVEGDDVDKKIRAFWYPPYDGANITIAKEKYTLLNRTLLQTLADPTVSSLLTHKK